MEIGEKWIVLILFPPLTFFLIIFLNFNFWLFFFLLNFSFLLFFISRYYLFSQSLYSGISINDWDFRSNWSNNIGLILNQFLCLILSFIFVMMGMIMFMIVMIYVFFFFWIFWYSCFIHNILLIILLLMFLSLKFLLFIKLLTWDS